MSVGYSATAGTLSASVNGKQREIMAPMFVDSNRETTPIPHSYAGQSIYSLLCHRPNYRNNSEGWEYTMVRRPEQQCPRGSREILNMTGGAIRYLKPHNNDLRHPWRNRLLSADRQAYVVWGQPHKQRIFNPDRPIHMNSGRGVIYTRIPDLDAQGQITSITELFLMVEFQLLNRRPEVGIKLRYKVDKSVGDYSDSDSPIRFYGRDQFWHDMAEAARKGFDNRCTHYLDPSIMLWRDWFFEQREAQDKWADDQVGQDPENFGWLAELDAVTEAWQLELTLSKHRRLFPELPPQHAPEEDTHLHPTERELIGREGVEATRQRLAEGSQTAGYLQDQLIIPAYEGTRGSMEGALLKAYLHRRPERERIIQQWMEDFVLPNGGNRNYTGD